MHRAKAARWAVRLIAGVLSLGAVACGARAAGQMSTSGLVGADASNDANGEFPDAAGKDAVAPPSSGSAACAAVGGLCLTNCANNNSNVACDPGAGSCCLDRAICPDGGPNLIAGSNYDQSCTTDSDCLEVQGGDACFTCIITCGSMPIVINRTSYPRYMADVSRTLAAAAQPGVLCGCPLTLPRAGPYCRGGTCTNDPSAPDATAE